MLFSLSYIKKIMNTLVKWMYSIFIHEKMVDTVESNESSK